MFDGVDPRVVEVLRYLVAKMLAGESIVVRAVYDYMVNDLSPALVVAKYESEFPWLSKYVLRGWRQRLTEKAPESLVVDVLRKAYAYLMEIGPVVEETDEVTLYGSPVFKCGVCGAEVPKQKVFTHVRWKHRNMIDLFVLDVIDKVRNGWSSKKEVVRA